MESSYGFSLPPLAATTLLPVAARHLPCHRRPPRPPPLTLPLLIATSSPVALAATGALLAPPLLLSCFLLWCVGCWRTSPEPALQRLSLLPPPTLFPCLVGSGAAACLVGPPYRPPPFLSPPSSDLSLPRPFSARSSIAATFLARTIDFMVGSVAVVAFLAGSVAILSILPLPTLARGRSGPSSGRDHLLLPASLAGLLDNRTQKDARRSMWLLMSLLYRPAGR